MNTAIDLYGIYSNLDGFQIIEPQLDYEVPVEELNPLPIQATLEEHGPIRVLLAEDDPDTGLLMTHILMKAGLRVTRAENGEEALEHALALKSRGAEFDIILMDLQMPKLDGYGAASTLRYKGYSGPIIALTARPLDEDYTAYLEAGCDHFVVKSDVHDRLLSLIARCVVH